MPDKYIRIKVIPKSAKSEIIEKMNDGTVKIRLKATPEKGRANKELISFLSSELKIPKNRIAIISGATDQLKLIRVYGPDE